MKSRKSFDVLPTSDFSWCSIWHKVFSVSKSCQMVLTWYHLVQTTRLSSHTQCTCFMCTSHLNQACTHTHARACAHTQTCKHTLSEICTCLYLQPTNSRSTDLRPYFMLFKYFSPFSIKYVVRFIDDSSLNILQNSTDCL